jgi:single-strand DNA-binding protein
MSVSNHVMLTGNVGKDLEVKYTSNGTAYSHMSLAIQKRYKDKEGQLQKVTDWFNLTIWGKQAEALSKFVKAGALVSVAGELMPKKKEGEDGKSLYTLEVKVLDVNVHKNGGGGKGDREAAEEDSEPSFGDIDD